MLYTFFKYSAIAILVSSYKAVPFAYYIRFYNTVLNNLILSKYFKYFQFVNEERNPFKVVKFNTYNSLFECDFYLHKSNSCYFAELDIARTHLVTSVLQSFFVNYKTESKVWPFVPVANIFTSFKKEIKPFAKYSIQSRIFAWDSKWLFIISKFVLANGKVASVTITKYVLKDGRKTIRPVDALKFEGIYEDKYEVTNAENLKKVEYFVNTEELDEFEL